MSKEIIEQAKASFEHAKGRLERAFETTPDDRINWSPAPTARTAVHQVAHSAMAIKSIHEMLDGRTFGVKTTEEADRTFREWEQQFDSRESVLAVFQHNSAAYMAWLNALTPDRLDSMIDLPFGMGQAPLSMGLTFAPAHTHGHASQIEYIQTIYGDQDWH